MAKGGAGVDSSIRVALRKTTERNDSPTQRNRRDLRCVALRTTTEWNGPESHASQCDSRDCLSHDAKLFERSPPRVNIPVAILLTPSLPIDVAGCARFLGDFRARFPLIPPMCLDLDKDLQSSGPTCVLTRAICVTKCRLTSEISCPSPDLYRRR